MRTSIVASALAGFALFTSSVDAAPSLTGRQLVATGVSHSLVVRSDGMVYGFGSNTQGQLAAPMAQTYIGTPVLISGPFASVQSVAAGYMFSMVLDGNGEVFTFGQGNDGQLGNGANALSNSAVQVEGLSHITAIAAGKSHALALKEDGTVYAWGLNSSGQLGDGTTVSSNVPVQVSGLSDIVAITGGSVSSMALKADGSVYVWGNNGYANLGIGNYQNQVVPVKAPNLPVIREIAMGMAHTLAVGANGKLYAAGANWSGQLGDGTTTSKSYFIQVPGLEGIVGIGTGSTHSLALKANGTVFAFGSNSSGQLCNGSTTTALTPTPISSTAFFGHLQGSAPHSIHNVLLTARSELLSCGSNWSGQLGNGQYNAGVTSPTAVIPVW